MENFNFSDTTLLSNEELAEVNGGLLPLVIGICVGVILGYAAKARDEDRAKHGE